MSPLNRSAPLYEYFFCASSGTNNSVGAAVPERSEVSLIFYLNPPEQVEESDVMPFENVINSYPNERIDPVLLSRVRRRRSSMPLRNGDVRRVSQPG